MSPESDFLWFLSYFLGALGILFGPFFYKMWKERRTAAWPMVAARFLDSQIERWEYNDETNIREVFKLIVHFSYSTENGERHEGRYVEEAGSEEQAERLAGSLKHGPFYVRYHPSKPWESFIDPQRDVLPPS